MAGLLLIGYDIESGCDGVQEELKVGIEITREFLKVAQKVHIEENAPATLFIVGQTLEKGPDAFQEVKKSSIFDLQQHTYSHKFLKNVCLIPDGEFIPRCLNGMSLKEIREEISKTNNAFRKILGIDCIGLTGPKCYYLGLCDRPDILEILHEEGIRFLRTWGRNERGIFNIPIHVQPFWYKAQGFPDMLEFPIHAGNDCREMGWENTSEYLLWVKKHIDFIAEHNLIYNYCGHDHAIIKNDPGMSIAREMIRYARDKGVAIRSYREEYEMKKNEDGRIECYL